jgi:hypothetical protein
MGKFDCTCRFVAHLNTWARLLISIGVKMEACSCREQGKAIFKRQFYCRYFCFEKTNMAVIKHRETFEILIKVEYCIHIKIDLFVIFFFKLQLNENCQCYLFTGTLNVVILNFIYTEVIYLWWLMGKECWLQKIYI